MTFPIKRVKICGLKSAFIFFTKKKKKKFVNIFILQGRKKRRNSI